MAAEAGVPLPATASQKPDEAPKPEAATVVASHPRGGVSTAPNMSIAAHPRAARAVARAKALGGLAGFLLGGYLSLPTHTLPAAAVRALLAGIVCWVAVWSAAVFLWRRLVVAELRHAQHQLLMAELSTLGVEGSTSPGGGRAR